MRRMACCAAATIVVAVMLAVAGRVPAQVQAPKARPTLKKADAVPAKPAAAPVKPAAPVVDHAADEKAIRQNIDAFVKAYNAHDAKALAALFTTDGELVDEDGDARQGRADIESVFAAVFGEEPQATMTVAIKSLRFPSATVAVEDGTTTIVHNPDEQPDESRYSVLHVKQDGKWLMASARDLRPETTSPADELKQLDWLIGDWVDESAASVVATSNRWTENHCYILSEFTIHVAGRPVMSGSQRIGWDPLDKVIRCWVFDSEGGFGSGVYAHDGNQWIVKMTSVTRDGQPASATNITTHVDKDRMTWQSRDRIVAGQSRPDVEPVMIVGKPPEPR